MSSETTAVTVVDAEAVRALATMQDPPEVVLQEAKKAATALRDVIAAKPKKVVMNGEQYLEFEDWQTLARFYGISAKEDGDPEFVDMAGVKGFKASSVALFRGQVISRATAYCLNDEEKWGTRTKYEWAYVKKSGGHSVEDPGKDELVWEEKGGKRRPKRERIKVGDEAVPMFQLASMAQTRANAKALRNVLSWVVVLAGYRTTPAEELPNAQDVSRQPGEDDGDEPADAKTAVPSSGPSCPHCKGKNIGTAQDGKAFCRDCGRGI